MADRLPRPALCGVDPSNASSPSGRSSTSAAGTRRTALYPSIGFPARYLPDLRVAKSVVFNALDSKTVEDACGALNRYWEKALPAVEREQYLLRSMHNHAASMQIVAKISASYLTKVIDIIGFPLMHTLEVVPNSKQEHTIEELAQKFFESRMMQNSTRGKGCQKQCQKRRSFPHWWAGIQYIRP